MKIKVKDLEANPYRNIAKYPIDRAKVDALKISIKETSFWDNILVRPHPTKKGKYQISYGHHRHIAIIEVGLKEIDVPCRNLTDAQMVKIMAEENLGWNTSPAVINETVLATKKFLDDELAKCETLSQFNKSIKLIETKSQFDKLKQTGVGQTTILKFLGGNWKQWMVQNALATLKADALPVEKGGVDRKAVETLLNMEAANRFRSEIAKHKIPKATQRKIAKRIVGDGIGSRDVQDTVRSIAKPEHLDRVKPKKIPTLDKFVDDTITSMQGLRLKLARLRSNIGQIQSSRVHGHLFMECGNLIKALNKILAEKENVKKTG